RTEGGAGGARPSGHFADRDRLRAVPETAPADFAEPVLPAVVGLDRREVVGGELADLRGRRAGAVREEDLALADSARVHRQHPRGRVRGVVLVVDAGPEVAIRDPGRFTAPPAVDEPRRDREHPPDRLDRLRRVRLPASAKVEVADLDLERGHARRIAVAVAARPTISTHVLDTERGAPAPGVRVTLSRLDVGDSPIRMTQALTDGDGRVRDLLEPPLVAGDYRLEFDVAHEDGSFFTKLAVAARSADPNRSNPVLPPHAPDAMTRARWPRRGSPH